MTPTDPAPVATNDTLPPPPPRVAGPVVVTRDVARVKAETPAAEAPPAPAPAEAPAAPPPAPPPPATPAEAVVRQEAEPPAVAVPKSEEPAAAPAPPSSILTIDVGGTKVKILATGQTEPRKAPTGRDFTPAKLVETVRHLAHDWEYEALSIGLPALVGPQGPRSEPGNLGFGWVGFDYAAAFDRPVKIINDAAMQALGSYEGGRMLFLGFGTGLGSALIAENVIVPLELGDLPYRKGLTVGDVLGRQGLERLGRRAWSR